MMDRISQNLAVWFGTSPFILFHIVWFAIWTMVHVTHNFDPDWSALTLIVSLEAIFLSLFILRAENIEAARDARHLRRELDDTRKLLSEIKSLKDQ